MSKSVPKAHTSYRLDRLLSNLGYGSRRDVQKLVKMGYVTLDGEAVPAPDDHIELTPDLVNRMLVYDEPLDPLPGMVVMLHKPLGVSCSHKEKGDIVYDLFPERWRDRNPPLSTVGRLDKETTGLLLLTDDGSFLHNIISPATGLTKRYRATLAQDLNGTEGKLFASGELMLEGEDKPLLPADFEMLSLREAYVTVKEGRYHQVRRMFAATGNHVIHLHRDRIGQLDLPNDLEVGHYRLLDASTKETLLTS